jgi:heme/copper-type cytochrome/quinol oxidase subunit 2
MKRKADNVSWKLKRRFGDLGYGLRKHRLPTTEAMTPSTTLIIVAVMAFVVFILVGGIYDILEKPLAILPKATSGWTFIYRGSINQQTINESLVSGLLYTIGIAGLYMLLRSTRMAYRPRQAYILLILGVVVLLIVVYYTSTMLQDKITTS